MMIRKNLKEYCRDLEMHFRNTGGDGFKDKVAEAIIFELERYGDLLAESLIKKIHTTLMSVK